MEVKKIQGLECQKNEFLRLIGELVDQVAYWKEYAGDLQTQVEDLGHDLDDCDAECERRKKEAQEAIRERNIKNMKLEDINRTMRSIQSELSESLAGETYEVLAGLFDLDLPFTES